MQMNKQKLIDLAIKSFKSSEFEFVKKRKVEGNNKIHVNNFNNYDIITYAENIKFLSCDSFRNTKSISVPDFTFSIRFGEPRRILKLNYKFYHPRYRNIEGYDLAKTRRSFWAFLDPFRSNYLETYTLKKDLKPFYLKCGKIKEYLTLEEYLDLVNTLKGIYEDRLKSFEDDIINKDITAVELALSDIK